MSRAGEIYSSVSTIIEELEAEKQASETVDAPVAREFRMTDFLQPQKVANEEELDAELEKIAKPKEKIVKPKEKTEEQLENEMMAGAGVSLAGGATVKKQFDKGNISGREKLYHNTEKADVDSIKKTGLKGSMATSEKAFTPDMLSDVDKSKLEGKVYLARKKSVANAVGTQASRKKIAEQKGIPMMFVNPQKAIKRNKTHRETLKAKVPTWKMKEVDNPELRGAKNAEQFAKHFSPFEQVNALLGYQGLSRKGTAVIQGDVGAKYIKGHKGYKGADIKEMIDFIKKNPKRFAKGVAGVAGGTALATAGGALAHRAGKQYNDRQEKVNKVACMLLEECMSK